MYSVFSNFRLSIALLTVLNFVSCHKENGCYKEQGKVIEKELFLEDFHSINNKIHANFVLNSGAHQSVKIKGDKKIVQLIQNETEVIDGVWNLDFESCVTDYQPVEIEITLPHYLSITNNGLANMSAPQNLNTTDFTLKLGGSGDLNIALNNINELNVELSGTGNIQLSGSSEIEKITNSGNGVVDCFNLPVQIAHVEIIGNGSCLVHVTDTLNASINGNGTVYYKGFPLINQTIVGGGQIVDAN